MRIVVVAAAPAGLALFGILFVAAVVLFGECFKERHRCLASPAVGGVKNNGRVHGLLLSLSQHRVNGIDVFDLLNNFRSFLLGPQKRIDPIPESLSGGSWWFEEVAGIDQRGLARYQIRRYRCPGGFF